MKWSYFGEMVKDLLSRVDVEKKIVMYVNSKDGKIKIDDARFVFENGEYSIRFDVDTN